MHFVTEKSPSLLLSFAVGPDVWNTYLSPWESLQREASISQRANHLRWR